MTEPKALDALAPEEGDIQRRCWTVGVFSNGNAQCWLYNGHPGDCQFAAPVPTATLDALRAENERLTRLLAYLWREADVEAFGDGGLKVCDLFLSQSSDPLAVDIEAALASLPAEQPATPETEAEA